MAVNLKRALSDTGLVVRRDWRGMLALTVGLWLVLEATYLPRALAYAGSARDLSGPIGFVLAIAQVVGSSIVYALISASSLARLSTGAKSAPMDSRSALLAVPTIIAVRLALAWPHVLEPLLIGWNPQFELILKVALGGVGLLFSLAYAALFGLFVPTLVAERLGVLATLARAFNLLRGARATLVVAFIVELVLGALPQTLLRIPIVQAGLQEAAARFGVGPVYLAEIQVTLAPIALFGVAYGVFVAAYYRQCVGVSPSRATIVETFS